MTNHITKTWFDGKTVVTITKEIPVEEFYKREWVGLTDEEVRKICVNDWGINEWGGYEQVRAIEAKLKEKNAL